MRNDLEQQVKIVIASCLAVHEDQLDSNIQLVEQLYADSLDLLDIMMLLNEEFDIDLGEDELINIKTVSSVCLEVEKKLTKMVL